MESSLLSILLVLELLEGKFHVLVINVVTPSGFLLMLFINIYYNMVFYRVTHWTFHGELDTTPPISQPVSVLDTSPVIDDIRGLVRDALGVNSLDSKSEESSESRLEGDIDGDIEGYIEEESKEDIEEESKEDIEEESEEDIEEESEPQSVKIVKVYTRCSDLKVA